MTTNKKPRDYFLLGDKCNSTYRKAWCSACIEVAQARFLREDQARYKMDCNFIIRSEEELQAAAKNSLDWLTSKPHILSKHLTECRNVAEDVRAKFSTTTTQATSTNVAVAVQPFTGPLAVAPSTTPAQVKSPIEWSEHEVQEINRDLLRVIASTNSSFNIVNNPMFQHFLRKYARNPPIASAATLRDKYLKEVVKEIENNALQRMKGKLGMGQCDGWTNVAKTSLIAILVKVEERTYAQSLHDVSAERKTAENLLNLVLAAILELRNAEVEIVGWVSDAGGDSRAMRLKLSDLMPQMIVLDCWAHQINLIVGDYFKLKGVYTDTIDDAVRIVRWFNTRLRALGLLRKVQIAVDGKTRALIEPCLTRWTSHYHSMNRLCDLKVALQSCWAGYRPELQQAGGEKPEQREATGIVSRLIGNEEFWDNLESVCKHLRPLTVASNMTQGSRGALYSVVLTLANLYRIYSSDEALDANVKRCLLDSIEKRWAKTDQDSFLSAVILNPYIRQRLFKNGSPYSAIGSVFKLFVRLWKRFFDRESDGDFLQAVFDYCRSDGSFSDEAMFLQDGRKRSEVMTLDVLKLWIVQDDGTYVGKNQLVKLALRVHSAVANSADCERFFSRMGAIHTKSRNRLDPQVVRNLAVVKMAIQEEFKKDALINRKRKREEFEELHTPKRSLSSKPPAPISNPAAAASTSAGPSVAIAHPDEAEEADADEANGGNETPMSTRELVTALTTAADGDDIADDTESFDVRLLDASIMERITGMTPSPSPAPVASPAAIHAPSPGSDGQPRHYFGTQQVCPIGDLFDFSDKKMEMWDSIGRHGEVWYSREEVELENRSRASTAEIEDIDTSTLHKPVKMEP